MTQPTVQTAEEAAVALRDEMCAIGRQFQDEGGDAQAFYDSAIILCIERHIAARDAAIRADERGKVITEVKALNIAWAQPFTRWDALDALASPPPQPTKQESTNG